jgi:hypothetical protein
MTIAVSSIHEVNDHLELRIAQLRGERNLVHDLRKTWIVAPDFNLINAMGEEPIFSQMGPHTSEGVWEDDLNNDGDLLHMIHQHGRLSARIVASSFVRAKELLANLIADIPEYKPADPDIISVTFWTNGPNGPISVSRNLDSETWDGLVPNYAEVTRSRLAHMMSTNFVPGKGGQLLLWHGPPGTGKTTALRSLAAQWKPWCDMHYIVDPDVFFGSQAAYMYQVLMSESGDLVDGEETGMTANRWRVLILEDCGELLAPDARQEVGQALSRLLNVCDGMIGRGLRLLILITTNEPIAKLHKAIARPGRCAELIEFHPFTSFEAVDWLEAHEAVGVKPPTSSQTLADLYGALEGFSTEAQEMSVGFA